MSALLRGVGLVAALAGGSALLGSACATPSTTPVVTAPVPPAPSPPLFDCRCDHGGPPALDPGDMPVDVSLDQISSCSAPRRECQACFDCFAWQLFLGVSWPAGRGGAADPAKYFGEPGDYSPLVWETYADVHAIFDQRALPAWEEHGTGKTLDTVNLRGKLQADHSWLTDRDGNLVRYELRVNKDLYEYIRVNGLNTRDGLYKAFKSGHGVELPAGGPDSVGTVEIKAAWRVVPEGREEEFKPRYKLSRAKIEGVEKTVALIGMHIAKKTPKLDQWAWATFEHESNAPPLGGEPGDTRYNLFNAALPADYKPNQDSPPDHYGTPPTPSSRPVQVRRVAPLGEAAARLNAYMARVIAAKYPRSVFLHYQLVDVQWPMKPTPVAAKPVDPPPDGDPHPAVVANLTMETFMQYENTGGGAGSGDGATRPPPGDQGKSSCVGCHRLSSVTPSFPGTQESWHTDYSTIFFNAR